MSQTTFSGPVRSLNGFNSGSLASPQLITTAGNANADFVSTSATNGDTRVSYQKLTFTAAGSGETLRAYTSIATGAGAVAVGGTVNGAHVSLDIDGTATVSGAGNALRATLGGTSTNPGGTLAALQLDSNFASGGTWTNASFLRVTNSGTGVIGNFAAFPAAAVAGVFRAAVGTPAATHTIPVKSNGTTYYIMVSTIA